MSGIKPINFERHDIGARIKKSKAQFIWKFSLDSQMVTIELICSHLSGKKKVFRDGKCIFDIQRFGTSFQYPFQINNHMLNIIQHGEMFELRIDNQSFQHLFNQDKTRKAFVFDGEESQPQTNKYDNYESNQGQDRRDQYNASSNSANENNDYGYGGYKKGHSDVNQFWNNNASGSGAFDSDNIRNKPYDSYSPQRENAKSTTSQNNNRGNAGNNRSGSNNGGLTYFNNFDQGVKFKKAEYVNKADSGNNGDNLLDLGFGATSHSQQLGNQSLKSNSNIGNNNFFDFDFNSNANQNSQTQNNAFDFDFPGGQTQNTNSNINSKQQQNKQAAVFDFNSYNNINTNTQVNQQQNQHQIQTVNTLDELFQSSQSQPQKSLDELFNVSSVPQANNINQSLNFEEQRRIQELIQTGYNQQQNVGTIRQNQPQQQQQQFVPNPMANMGSNFNIQQQQQHQQQQQNLGGFQFNNFQFNNTNNQQIGKDKENLESKLVNLDSLAGGVSNNQAFGGKSNQDPFADAFSSNTRSGIPINNQKDAFSFVQNQITTDVSPDNHTKTKQRSSLLGNKGVITSDQMMVNFSTTATQNTSVGFSQTSQTNNINNGNDFFFGFNAQANQNSQNQHQDNDFKFF